MGPKSSCVGPVLVGHGARGSRALLWPSSYRLGPYLRSPSGLSCRSATSAPRLCSGSPWRICGTLGPKARHMERHEAAHLTAWMEFWERPAALDLCVECGAQVLYLHPPVHGHHAARFTCTCQCVAGSTGT